MIWCWRRCEAEHSIFKERNWFNKSENLIRPWFDKINNALKLNWNCTPFEVGAVKSKSTFFFIRLCTISKKKRLHADSSQLQTTKASLQNHLESQQIVQAVFLLTSSDSCIILHDTFCFDLMFNGDFECYLRNHREISLYNFRPFVHTFDLMFFW